MLKKISMLLSIFAFALVSASGVYAVGKDDVLGVWGIPVKDSKTVFKTEVEIYNCGEKYCGKMIKVSNPEALDAANKDEALKGRKLLGLEMIWGFEFDDGMWEDGKIYNAENGKTYNSKMSLKSNEVLEVKGCVAFFCQGMDWYRIK
ncbi:DUF2147 domain-containing protein [bacterium]|nr:DUF2147 domain-containing protein [bacterium]